MSNQTLTYLVAAVCGSIALTAYVGLIVMPAVTAYTRWWERAAAGFLTVYVLAAFVVIGVGGGAAVVYFWDRIAG